MATTHARTPAPARPGTPVTRSAREASGRPTHLRLVTSADGVVRPLARERAVPQRQSGGRPGPADVWHEPPLRLTRRGKLVLRGLVVAIMLVLMAGAALTMAHRADASDGPARRVVVVRHVVLPGETLWSIATSVAPKADPRDTIARIVEFNALTSSEVHAGESLGIPPGLPGR